MVAVAGSGRSALLPRPLTRSDAGHRRALDQPLAAARLRAELLECRACGDPARDQAVAVIMARLLKLPRRSLVLAEDETHLHLSCRSGRITGIR
jgi:hypothetical protein